MARSKTQSQPGVIRIVGAREHNLRNLRLELPAGRLICFTGVSGSGKSSLAFDTLYAEGQRRYIESLSSYARQFLGELPRPNVDQIQGLSPSVAIQQKTTGWNPRSTVGTITQIHDYLRVLYARVGTPHCPQCGRPIASQTREQMVERVLELPEGTRIAVLAPRVRQQKGEFRELFEELSRQGFVRARVDGQYVELRNPPKLDRYRRHDIEVVVDRLVIQPDVRRRLSEALELALEQTGGEAIVAKLDEHDTQNTPARRSSRRTRTAGDILLSRSFACTHCGLGFSPPTPQLFSFNSPQGMCPTCDGLGVRNDFDPELLIPDPRKKLFDPAIAAWRTKPGRWRRHIYEGVARYLGIDLNKPWNKLPEQARHALLYGTGNAHISFEWRGRFGTWRHGGTFEGILAELREKYRKSTSPIVRRFYEQFMRQTVCPDCRGARLNAQALAVRITGRGPDDQPAALNIHELCQLAIDKALAFVEGIELDALRARIAREPLKEIRTRLRFLLDVGLGYLTLDRAAPTLSGGESQRIRLASQIGSGLVGVLYILDEPSIGLHARDQRRLLDSLKRLRDMGNTVIVVEHDRDTMESADWIVDFGPGPGVRGGQIVTQGTLDDVAASPKSLTGAYLAGREQIPVPEQRRPVPKPPVRRRRR